MAIAKKAGKKKGSQKKAKNENATRRNDSAAVLTTILGCMVSILVLVAAILLKPLLEKKTSPYGDALTDSESNFTSWPPADPRVGFLVSRACTGSHNLRENSQVYCHPDLRLSKRHFRATRRIEPGEVLFEIPRAMQVWDLDALRDPWIRLHLFEASHRLSGNKVGSEAFLAVYLALQLKRKDEGAKEWDMEILDLAYFDTLYYYKEWKERHPLFDDPDHMKGMLGFSEGYGVLQAYRNMILSEYEAFHDFSEKFRDMVTQREYFTARMNVLTRAVHVGAPGPEHAIKGTFLKDDYSAEQLLKDEIESYKEILGIDLARDGCIALIPIADLFNHHPQNTVEHSYTRTERNPDSALVVRADHRHIEVGFEPLASYGRNLPDAHLFARYGFVNGDGSGPTQVSLAFHHDILKLNISSQYDYLPSTGATTNILDFMKKPVAEYLRFDDGYRDCIPGPSSHPKEAYLKRLKHQHLLKISNSPNYWQIILPARNPFAYPGYTHDKLVIPDPPEPIEFYTRQNLDIGLALSTCRLISLTIDDYSGQAGQLLQDNLNNEDFFLGEGNDSLEYRALKCVRRWLGAGLMNLEGKFGSTRSQKENVLKMNQGSTSVGTRDWGAVNVRLGEMQSLKAAAVIVGAKIVERWGNGTPEGESYVSREEPCPAEYLAFLFKELYL